MFCSSDMQVHITFGNHLSKFNCLNHTDHRFILLDQPPLPKVWVARLWGLPRLKCQFSLTYTFLWHIRLYSDIARSLSLFDRRGITAPGFILYPGTNTTPISECASMDLPHVRNMTRNYPILIQQQQQQQQSYFTRFHFQSGHDQKQHVPS